MDTLSYTYFKDRNEAGKSLAKLLNNLPPDTIIYALPRGGVIIASEISKELKLPLNLIVAKKISSPYSSELAIGAVSADGSSIYTDEILSIDPLWIADSTKKAQQEAKRQKDLYTHYTESISCSGKTALLVDDGIATGLTLKAAIQELKIYHKPNKIIVVAPVASSDVIKKIEQLGVEVITKLTVRNLTSVSQYYQSFPQVTDAEVIKTLKAFLSKKTRYSLEHQSTI